MSTGTEQNTVLYDALQAVTLSTEFPQTKMIKTTDTRGVVWDEAIISNYNDLFPLIVLTFVSTYVEMGGFDTHDNFQTAFDALRQNSTKYYEFGVYRYRRTVTGTRSEHTQNTLRTRTSDSLTHA